VPSGLITELAAGTAVRVGLRPVPVSLETPTA
jgi:hypothetical protein